MANSAQAVQRITVEGLNGAVHKNKAMSREGILERLFTFAFRGLVYPQIWEDPVIDMEALKLLPSDRIITIASGGCNALSYLTANPEHVTAVDLNGAHIALTKLKIAAARSLPDHESFFRFFGKASDSQNVKAYEQLLRPVLDPTTKAYWDSRRMTGQRRISMFARGFYRYGLLGNFIGAGHLLGRLYGANPAVMLQANSLEEQRALFDRHIAPVFERPTMRWLLRQPASLYGLGIPPSQYRSLAGDHDLGIGAVLRARLEKLACGFDIKSNYYAWQAFGRSYAPGSNPSLPPYLEAHNFQTIRERAGRVEPVQGSMTAILAAKAPQTLDAYVLLDAQDWMNDEDLTALWSEITRTARPGARVIFRTAANERLLPGRIPNSLLNVWQYEEDASRDFGARDRSSIYGAFHLYTLKG